MQRVTEQLLRLAVDQPAAPTKRSIHDDEEASSSSSLPSSSRLSDDEQSRHQQYFHQNLSPSPSSTAAATAATLAPMLDVDPARAVAALTRAYDSGEKYADVRTAVVQALPRVRGAADFVLSCVQLLASPSPSDVSGAPSNASASNPSSVPLIQLMLEALSLACVAPAPRPVFAALDGAATRVTDPAARARAASMLGRGLQYNRPL